MEFDTLSEQVSNFGDAVDVATEELPSLSADVAVAVEKPAEDEGVKKEEGEEDDEEKSESDQSNASTSSSSEDLEAEEKPISVSQLKKYLKEKYNVDLTHAQFDVDAEGKNVLYVPSKADYKASGLPDPMPSEEMILTIIENEGVYIERAPANEDDIPEKLLVAGEKAEEDGADLAEFIVDDDVVETLPSSASKKRKDDAMEGGESADASSLPDGIDPANIIEELPTRSCVAKAHKRIKYMIEYFEKGKVVVPPEDAALVCSDATATVVEDMEGAEDEEGEDCEEEDGEDEDEGGKNGASEEMGVNEGDEDDDWVPMEESEEDEEEEAPVAGMDVDGGGPQAMDEEEEEEEEEAMETDEDD